MKMVNVMKVERSLPLTSGTDVVYAALQHLIGELRTAGNKEAKKGGLLCRGMQLAFDIKDDAICLYAVMGVYCIPADFIPVELPSDSRVMEVTALVANAMGQARE